MPECCLWEPGETSQLQGNTSTVLESLCVSRRKRREPVFPFACPLHRVHTSLVREESPAPALSQTPASSIVTHSHTALKNKDIATQDTAPGEPHPEALAPSWWLFALSQISCISRNGCNAGSTLVPLHLTLLYHLFFSWVHFLCVALPFSAFTSLLQYLKQLFQSLFLVGASAFNFFPALFFDFSFSAFISAHLFFLSFFLFLVFPVPLSRKDALLGLIDGLLETD